MRVFRICQSCGRGVVVESHNSKKCPKCGLRLNGCPEDWVYNRKRIPGLARERARVRYLMDGGRN